MKNEVLARESSRLALPVLGVAALIAVFLPPVVFMLVAVSEGMGINGGVVALLEQYQADRQNLAVLGLVGVLPLLLLALVIWVMGFIKRLRPKRRRLATGGAISILLVLTWVNFEFWPTFLPDRAYAGFPHGLEFVIGPLVFAPIAMIVGMLVAGFTSAPTSRADRR